MIREISVQDHTELWAQKPHISAYSEAELMETIRDAVGECRNPILCGVGDDAAVISVAGLGAAELVMSTDMLVEERHFRLPWISPFDLGRRSIVHSAADCVAMTAEPIAYTLAMNIPKNISLSAVRDFIAGARYQAELWFGQLVGGDFVCGDAVVISVTVLGGIPRKSVYLTGAQIGDIIAISAPIGLSAAGLACYQQGISADTPDDELNTAIYLAQQRFLVPLGPVDMMGNFQGPEIFEIPGVNVHALTDISDGLVHELTIMSQKSQVRIEVDPAEIPVDPVTQKLAQYLNRDLQDFILQGGEDHILLGSFASENLGDLPPLWYPIGKVQAGNPAVVLLGTEADRYRGWDSVQS